MKKIILLVLCIFLSGCSAGKMTITNYDIGSTSFYSIDEKGTLAINSETIEKTIVVDMFEGGHFVADNTVVEWRGNSIYNRTIQEINEIEKEMLASLGSEVTLFTSKDGIASEPKTTLKSEGAMTLSDFAANNGYEYLRIPCKADEWPSAVKVDSLINYFKNIEGNTSMILNGNEVKLDENTSILFVGSEKSINSVICILTLLQNPDSSYEDIKPILYLNEDKNLPENEKVSHMAQLLVDYFNTNAANGYHASFNDWLLTHSSY